MLEKEKQIENNLLDKGYQTSKYLKINALLEYEAGWRSKSLINDTLGPRNKEK